MTRCANLGFPRIGTDRELKKAVENYWKGNISSQSLYDMASEIRRRHWQFQQAAGIDYIPSNDFSFYDHVLDTTAMLGAIPSRYHFTGPMVDIDTYFAMARGTDDVKPMEMTKWFDTNYHYIVPEFEKGQTFSLKSTKIIEEFKEAKSLGIQTRPVLLGPISYLSLGKSKNPDCNPIDLLERLLPIYQQLLSMLHDEQAEWIQIDEPVLVLDLPENTIDAFEAAYHQLCGQSQRPKICLTTYFGSIADKMNLLGKLFFETLHVDLFCSPQQLDTVLEHLSENQTLSLGVVDGRNIWKNNLSSTLCLIDKAVQRIGADRIVISSSCSMLHCPIDLKRETELYDEIKQRLAFSKQKLDEISLLKTAVEKGWDTIEKQLNENAQIFEQAKQSQLIYNSSVQQRVNKLDDNMFCRNSAYPERRKVQQESLDLPTLPTTTIGSFPQTADVRKTRLNFKKGNISANEYENIMQKEIESVVRFQEEAGLDVLVHGEPERNDMVEYFGQMLNGFAFTENGWVQSYGSRCVKPPIIYGDVWRDKPMTVSWSKYAQSLTSKLMKGMLTGPITIMQWSFVREDQPRKDTAWQIALCIHDEVQDLENAGIKIIQIDEPALREGAPLRQLEWGAYFDWSVKAFRLATSSVKDATQIHTHMCYCNFNDIIKVIAELDADVISIEASRSDAELLDVFVDYNYPNEIGPGVYDIHSPRVPDVNEIEALIKQMLLRLSPEQLWVNPDCGLKTRNWPEVKQSLKNMVAAAIHLRNDK